MLPDPAPRERQHVLISVDDHVIEPPDMFDGRLPAALAGRAPQIVETDDGRQVWRYEDRDYPNIGLNAVVGRPREDWRKMKWTPKTTTPESPKNTTPKSL